MSFGSNLIQTLTLCQTLTLTYFHFYCLDDHLSHITGVLNFRSLTICDLDRAELVEIDEDRESAKHQLLKHTKYFVLLSLKLLTHPWL